MEHEIGNLLDYGTCDDCLVYRGDVDGGGEPLESCAVCGKALCQDCQDSDDCEGTEE